MSDLVASCNDLQGIAVVQIPGWPGAVECRVRDDGVSAVTVYHPQMDADGAEALRITRSLPTLIVWRQSRIGRRLSRISRRRKGLAELRVLVLVPPELAGIKINTFPGGAP